MTENSTQIVQEFDKAQELDNKLKYHQQLMCFAIKDKKSNSFLDPFFNRSVVNACRQFSQLISDERNNVLFSYPEDFDLYILGYFTLEDGDFICLRELIMTGEEAQLTYFKHIQQVNSKVGVNQS